MFQGNTLAYKIQNGNLDFCQGSPHPTKHSLLQMWVMRAGGGVGGQMQIYFISRIFYNLIDVIIVLTGLVLLMFRLPKYILSKSFSNVLSCYSSL